VWLLLTIASLLNNGNSMLLLASASGAVCQRVMPKTASGSCTKTHQARVGSC
jgi:hypothetical protein